MPVCESSTQQHVAIARHMESAHYSISTTLLTPDDRIARLPLLSWAEHLVNVIQHISISARTTRTLAERLTSVANNAALIAAMRGDMLTAWTSTERHILWIGRLARRSRAAHVASYAVQPWINLGRIEALTGRWREALARCSTLWVSGLAGQLQLGALRLKDSQWSGIGPSREHCLNFLQQIYVADSLKTMLLNRQFELVRPFISNASAKGKLAIMCEEACIVADSKMGDHRSAIARAAIATKSTSGWSGAVMRLRMAEAHACAGELERARKILSQLAALIRQVSAKAKSKPEFMPITARVASACYEMELKDDALSVAIDVLGGASSANDEMIQIEMLQLLTDAATDENAEGWRRSARTAEEATDYARFRRGVPPRKTPVFDKLYAALEAAYM